MQLHQKIFSVKATVLHSTSYSLIFVYLLFYSCSNSLEDSIPVQRIDSLVKEIQHTNNEISTTRSILIDNIYEQMLFDEVLLSDLPDSALSEDVKNNLFLHHKIQSTIDSCLRACSNYFEEISYSEELLADYKNMFLQKKINATELEKLVDTEMQMANTLGIGIRERIHGIEKDIELYHTVYPILKKQLDSLQLMH